MDDHLDRILSSERRIVPSRTFADRVMSEVREIASTPEPIRFPWKRLLAGGLTCVVVSAMLIGIIVSVKATGAQSAIAVAEVIEGINQTGILTQVMWFAFGLASAYLCTRFVARATH